MSQKFPPQPDELDPALLAALGSLGAEQRDPLRRAAGRAAVMAAAARSREAGAGGRWLRWRRRVVVATLGFAGVNVALGGVVALAAGAQPDSLLYGVKRAAEEVKLSLTFDPVDKARLELQLADRRAGEAAAMAHSGHAHLALQAARDATDLVREAGATLTANPSVANEQALQHASDEALGRLREVFAALENGTDPGAAEAARSLDDTWNNGLGLGQGAGRDHGNSATGAGSQGAGAGQGAGTAGGTGSQGQAGGSGQGGASASHTPAASAHSGGHGGGTH